MGNSKYLEVERLTRLVERLQEENRAMKERLQIIDRRCAADDSRLEVIRSRVERFING